MVSFAHAGATAPVSVRETVTDGVLSAEIRIPDGVVLAAAIRLSFACDGGDATSRIVVRIGRRAAAVIVEELRSAPFARWSHTVEIELAEESSLEYASAQLADSTAAVTLSQRSRLAAGARIAWRNATLGGGKVGHDLLSRADGHNAVSDIAWLFYARGAESYRLTARNSFEAPGGGGEMTMKGVAEERGHVACDGMIGIGLAGGGTDTYLTQDVLMLDPTARVDAVPGLEIRTNDVKASHSATVSRVTEEDLFYFAARGIPRDDARGMYVQGFLRGMAARVSDSEARRVLELAIERKLVYDHPLTTIP